MGAGIYEPVEILLVEDNPHDAEITLRALKRANFANHVQWLKDGEQVKVAFAATTSGTVTARINLNAATIDELETVPGFSKAFALEVLDYRTNFGGFQSTRELVDILGMSEADYVIARRYLTL